MGALTYAQTGDPELDRVAQVDLAAARGAQSLPAPSMAQPSADQPSAGTAAPAPAPEQPAPATSKPFYKNPVTWVLAGVGIYVIYVLASSNDSSSNQPTDVRGLTFAPLGGGPSTAAAPTLFRF